MSRLYYGKPDTVEDLLKRLMALLSEDNRMDELEAHLRKQLAEHALVMATLEKRINHLEDQNESLKKQIRELKRTVDLLYSAADSKKEESEYKTTVTPRQEVKKRNFFN